MKSSVFDVAIVGGGVTGLTTALAMARLSSLRIALIESRSQKTRWQPGTHDSRVSALSPASQRIFERFGVWEWVAARDVSPFRRMQVWSAAGKGMVSFDAAELGVPALGHIVANNLLEAGLYEALETTCPQVMIISAAKPVRLNFTENGASIQLEQGAQIAARLVVGADGAGSEMRTLAGLSQTVRDYGHTALVAEVEMEYPHAETARQCFLPGGPLAFLPLSSPQRCSIVWSLPPDAAARLESMTETDFCRSLAEAFQGRAGVIREVTGRKIFPLMRRHAKNYVRERFVLVGDAAHTIHPLAGQGMNLGLLDAALLAETVTAQAKKGGDFAAFHVLRRWERARKAHTQTLLAAMDFFRTVPGHAHPVVQTLWQIGLRGVNRLPVIRKYLMEFAMGGIPDPADGDAR